MDLHGVVAAGIGAQVEARAEPRLRVVAQAQDLVDVRPRQSFAGIEEHRQIARRFTLSLRGRGLRMNGCSKHDEHKQGKSTKPGTQPI